VRIGTKYYEIDWYYGLVFIDGTLNRITPDKSSFDVNASQKYQFTFNG